jgi:hypothetical protein
VLYCRYAGQRQVVSVATKLKKFHAVMQECGGVKLGLQVRGFFFCNRFLLQQKHTNRVSEEGLLLTR